MKDTGVIAIVEHDRAATKRHFDWGRRRAPQFIDASEDRDIRADEWLAFRASHAARMLRDCVEISPRKCHGVPVFKGTRFTVARFLAELADGRSLTGLANDFDLDATTLEQFLRGLSICLDRPAMR